MGRSVDLLKPFSVEVLPVTSVSPGSYVLEDDDREINYPANHIVITNDAGSPIWVRLQPAMSSSDIIANGGFDNGDDWLATDWTIGAGVADHDTGNVTALSQLLTAGGIVIEDPRGISPLNFVRTMLVKFTVASRSAGDVRIAWSGTNPKVADNTFDGKARSTNATFVEVIRWPDYSIGGSGSLGFKPTSTFDGNVDDVKVYADGAHSDAGGHDLKILDGVTQIIPPSWGVRTNRISVWTAGTVANIGIWGMHVPANRV